LELVSIHPNLEMELATTISNVLPYLLIMEIALDAMLKPKLQIAKVTALIKHSSEMFFVVEV